MIKFQHRVQDDIMTLNARIFRLSGEMDAVEPHGNLGVRDEAQGVHHCCCGHLR